MIHCYENDLIKDESITLVRCQDHIINPLQSGTAGNDGISSPSSLLNEENLENMYMVFPLQKTSSLAKMI